jgi:hypothetical protein
MASEKDIIYIPGAGAHKIVNGEPVGVEAILAQDANSCCYLSCCDKAIIWVDDSGTKKTIALSDLQALVDA